jgi:formylglycine-generating enzyme required for sulfatase activity/TolB-like protein
MLYNKKINSLHNKGINDKGRNIIMEQRTFLRILCGAMLGLAGAVALAGCSTAPAVSTDDQLDAAIRETSDYLNASLPNGNKLVILNVQSEYPALSEYIIDELIANTVNDRVFTAVDRQQLDTIRAELDFQYSGEVDDDTMQELGRMAGAQIIVSGAVSKIGNSYRLRVRALGVQTARIEGQFNRNIPDGPTIAALAQSLATGYGGSGGRTVTSTPAPVQTQQQPAARVERLAVPDNFVRIEGGTFTMGSPESEPNRFDWDEPQHQVTVGSFYMGKYEVVMGTNPSNFKGAKRPVEEVSWYEAIEYCNRRSEREGLTPAYTINKVQVDPNNKNDNDSVKWLVTWNKNANGYRLPTEAEWEYACRAGLTSPFNTGSNITTSQANYNGNNPYNNNAKGTFREKTTDVGSFAANRWGLYDMHGNVGEWCWDWFGEYSMAAQIDPIGGVSGNYRMVRGGSWVQGGQYLRSAMRYSEKPSFRIGDSGFRLVRP